MHDSEDLELDEENETDEETSQNVVSIGAKSRPRAQREEEPVTVPLSPFGAVPADATYWAAHKAGLGGTWDTLSWGAPGDTVELREWPLADLSEETVRERWGAGIYKIQWLKATPRGGRKSITYGRPVTLRPVDPVAPPAVRAAAVAASPMGDAFALATQIMGMIEQNAEAKVQGYATMAQLIAGQNRGGGLGAAELQLILQNQATATKDLVMAAIAPLQQELRDLRSARDEDEPSGLPVAEAAAAAAPLIKGKGGWAAAINFAAANPKIVEVGLPVVAEMFGKLAGIFTPAPVPAPAPAPPAPAPRPRAMPEVAPAPAAVVPAVESSSLSSWRPTPDVAPASTEAVAAAS